MGLLDWSLDKAIDGIRGIFTAIGNIIDELHYSDEEKASMKLENKKLETQMIIKAQELEAARQSIEMERERLELEKAKVGSATGWRGFVIWIIDSGWRKVIFWTATTAFCYSTYLVFTSGNVFTPEAFKQMLVQGGEVLALAMIRQYDKKQNGNK